MFVFGGWGIKLMYKIVDYVSYICIFDDCNCLLIVKRYWLYF